MLSLGSDLAFTYQKLLDRIPNSSWIVDCSGQIYLANAAGDEYIKRSRLDSPSFLWSLFPAEERDRAKAQWQQNPTNQPWESQPKLRDAWGNYSVVCLQLELLTPGAANPLWIGTASPVQSAMSASDEPQLADYKQREIGLQRNVEFVRRIMESSRDCIKVLDLEGRLLYMNDGGQEIMEIDNFSAVEYISWLSFWHGCDREAAEQAFTLAKQGKIGRFDGYCATAKGTPRWWEVVVTPMFDRLGRVQEILSVSRDITARKKAESALQKRNQELDRFTYIVSHDLKAPLRAISNLSEWIAEDLEDRIPEENKQQLDLLGQRVRRMNKLIDGLLELSRVGRQELPLELVNVEDLLLEVVDSLAPPADFEIISQSLPVLFTKRILLSQVLSNLIGNAIKHHDENRGQIEIVAQDCDTHYEFAVIDDGAGIDESERERVFEIFQTLASSTSTVNTGIGLALVKKIVTEEGGKLWLEENTPKGCKFYFTWAKNSEV